MVRHAQTTMCRVRYLTAYFGDERENDCGHCDTCHARTAGQLRVRRAPARPRAARVPPGPARVSPFARGQAMRHRRFGTGEVVTVDPEGATVAFPAAGVKRLDTAYLRPAG